MYATVSSIEDLVALSAAQSLKRKGVKIKKKRFKYQIHLVHPVNTLLNFLIVPKSDSHYVVMYVNEIHNNSKNFGSVSHVILIYKTK